MKVGDSVKGNNILELLVGIAVLSVVIYVAVHIAGMIWGILMWMLAGVLTLVLIDFIVRLFKD